jgi:hypothetical protein
MRKRKFFFPLVIALIIGVLVGLVMLLWNAILPELFAVSTISYWQALGLLVLCRLLFGFGGFGRRRGGPPFVRQWPSPKGKWLPMSEEERGKFREEWRRRCERRKE